jgi:hypothetical protein
MIVMCNKLLIMRDVNAGWALRYTHANVASFFFIFLYAQFISIYFKILCPNTKSHGPLFKASMVHLKIWGDYHSLYYPFFNTTFFKGIIDHFLNVIKPLSNSINTSNNKTMPNFQYKDFIQWFVGFSDAEATFMINIKNNTEVHFVFQITLHIEDIAVLYTIR